MDEKEFKIKQAFQSQQQEWESEQRAWEVRHQTAIATRSGLVSVCNAMFEAIITIGQNASRSLLLVSGGSVAALLAFIGSLYSSKSPTATQDIANLVQPLVYFAWSIGLALVVPSLTYICQCRFGIELKTELVRINETLNIIVSDPKISPEDLSNQLSPEPKKIGVWIQGLVCVIAAASLGLTLWGLYATYTAFTSLGQTKTALGVFSCWVC